MLGTYAREGNYRSLRRKALQVAIVARPRGPAEPHRSVGSRAALDRDDGSRRHGWSRSGSCWVSLRVFYWEKNSSPANEASFLKEDKVLLLLLLRLAAYGWRFIGLLEEPLISLARLTPAGLLMGASP